MLAVHEEPAPNRFCLRKFDLTSFVLILRMLAAPVPFRSSPALLIQLKFDPTLLLFFGIIRAAKGPLPEMVRGTQRYSSGPGFDSPWERISG